MAFSGEVDGVSADGKVLVEAYAHQIWSVEVLVIELHDDVRDDLRDAQVRQFR
jgi:hypothetical protein